MKSSFFFRVLMIMLTVLLLAGCGNQKPPHGIENITPITATSTGSNPQPDTLRVVLGGNYPPFHFTLGNGRHAGIIIDMMRTSARRAGVKLQFRFINSWKRALNMVYSGEMDLILPLYKTPERNRKLVFFEGAKLAPEYNVFAVRKASTIHYSGNLSSMSNRLVGMIRGYSYGKKFDSLSVIRRAYAGSEVELLKQLLQPQRLNVIIASLPVLRFHMVRYQLSGKVKILQPPVSREWLYAGFCRLNYENGKIRDAVDRLVHQLQLYRNSPAWQSSIGKFVNR